MQKKFVGNLLFVVLLNLLVKPFWILGIDVAVQNRVGAEEYGLYYPILGFSILLNIVLDFGITNYNNRNIAQHSHMLGRYFSGIFNVKLFLGILYLVLTLLLGWIIGYEGEEIYLLLILSVNQFLASLILYLRSNLSGLHLFKTDGILSVLDRVLMIALCGALLWGNYFNGEFQIEWFVYAQFISYLITVLIAFFLVLAKAKFFKLRIDLTMFRIILRESLPFALLVLLMSFYYRLDSVMIERLLPNGRFEAGVYAQAYRLLEGFNMFGYMFAALLLPIFSRMIKEKQNVNKLVRTSFNLLFIPSIAIVVVSFLHPIEIMDILYLENIESSAEVYQILMISFIAIALTYIYGTLLTANGNLKALNIVSLIGLVLNFVLNYWLIPLKGAYGAALATLITQALIICLQIVITKKEFKMSYPSLFILKQILLVSIGGALAYYTNSLIESFVLHSLLCLFFFLCLTLILGLIKPKDILSLLRERA